MAKQKYVVLRGVIHEGDFHGPGSILTLDKKDGDELKPVFVRDYEAEGDEPVEAVPAKAGKGSKKAADGL